MTKAVILGAGRIGRGFVAEMLKLNNVEFVFFDAVKGVVDTLNENKEYTIHVLGAKENDLMVTDVRAYQIDDADALADCWKESEFIFTAVGGKNMKTIAVPIAKAFKKLIKENSARKSNIVICENWVNPAKDLYEGITEQLNNEEKELFDEYVGICESVILCTGTGSPTGREPENEMDTWVQNLRYLPIDIEPMKTEAPNWDYVEFVKDFGNLLTQKLYTNNTSVGSIAYLGRLRGLTHVAEATNDPEIEPIMDQIYEEINYALINGMGIDEGSQINFSKRAKAKYTDWDIVDVLTRIARDPIRKLKPNDRLIGPARIAISVGYEPKAISLAIAAALYYEDENDEAAVKLKAMRETKGVGYIMETICELENSEPLYGLILSSINDLKERGWIK